MPINSNTAPKNATYWAMLTKKSTASCGKVNGAFSTKKDIPPFSAPTNMRISVSNGDFFVVLLFSCSPSVILQ